MSEDRTLLICYDGTERAEHAVAVSATLFPGARAHVLNVWEPLERIIARYAVLTPYLGEGVGETEARIEAESAKLADAGAKLANEAGLNAVPRTASLRSTVWEAVVEVADAVEADAIITGTRALHGVREAFANTLSHALLQHSGRPVLAIPMPGPPPGA